MKARFAKLPLTHASSIRVRSVRQPVFDPTFHFHPEIELASVESSHGQLIVGDAIKSFAAGDLVLLGPNVPHSYYNAPRESAGPTWARSTVVQFNYEGFGPGFFELPDLRAVRQLLAASARGLLFRGRETRDIAELVASLPGTSGAARIAGLLNILELLTHLEGGALSTRTPHHSLRPSDMKRMNRVVALVHARFQERLSLPEVAKVAALTPEAFCRFFKRSTGRTFSRFVNEVRVAEACRLLVETDRTIGDIAFACGFGTLSNFGLRFSEICQTTPSAYRQSAHAAGSAQYEINPCAAPRRTRSRRR
jgi:AraC-like DNA-binding protein